MSKNPEKSDVVELKHAEAALVVYKEALKFGAYDVHAMWAAIETVFDMMQEKEK